jgi:hypothetical protein
MRALAIALVLAACSDAPSSTADAPPAVDAYDVARCLIKGNFGALGALTGTAATTMGAPTLTVTLDPGPPGRDAFFIKLVTGKGVFASGLAAGSYNISGADANYNNCGLCVHIIADIVPMVGPSKFYFADIGMVTLTSTNPIAGMAANLILSEVDINSGQKVAGGCQAMIESIAFSSM